MKKYYVKCKRRGVSLVELLVVMSAATVILTLSTGLIHRVMHAQTKARHLADLERTTLRLGNELRSDVHLATTATVQSALGGNGTFIRLQLVDGNVLEYRRDEMTVRRVQLQDGRVVAHDEFAFGETFELDANVEKDRLVVVSITSRDVPERNPADEMARSAERLPVDLQVVARLGQRGAK